MNLFAIDSLKDLREDKLAPLLKQTKKMTRIHRKGRRGRKEKWGVGMGQSHAKLRCGGWEIDPVIGTSGDRKGQILPLINTDDADVRGIAGG